MIAIKPDTGTRRMLDQLLSRRSTSQLETPAPEGPELELILDAGLRAPDHGHLRPWRFVLIRGEARARLGALLAGATLARDPSAAPALVERYRGWPLRMPLLIGVGTRLRPGHPVPEVEQLLSAGAAAMNMLNAIHLLGYGGIWVTGPNAYDDRVNAALGFTAPDRLVGFLAVGTPKAPPTGAPRPKRAAHVVEWMGAASNS